MLSPNLMLNRILNEFPDFKAQWEDSLFRGDDGSFTYHGLFSELSWYVRDHFGQMDEQKRESLFDLIELSISEEDRSDLENAVCTCFLENLASEPLSPELKGYMKDKTREYFEQWDNPARHRAT